MKSMSWLVENTIDILFEKYDYMMFELREWMYNEKL